MPRLSAVPATLAAMLIASVLSQPVPARAQGAAASGAVCPNPPPPDFDFWLGAWDVLNRQRQPTGDDPTWYDTGPATALVQPVVGGCAVAEYWWGDLSFDRLRGFSLRAFDHERDLWTAALFWPNPNQPAFGTLEGQFRHGRGEFFRARVDERGRTTVTRFTFTDIQANTARWDAAASGDSGISWRPNWIMEFTRRPPEAEAPQPAWADSVPRCDFPELYEFDFVLGEWAGTATVGTGDAQPARLHSRRIVGDCALEERFVIGDDFESFEVRAFTPTVDGWVGYRVDSRRPVLQHLEGAVQGGDAQLAGTRRASDGAEMLVTERWRWRGDTELVYDLRESPDDGQTWTVLVHADLGRVGDEGSMPADESPAPSRP